MRMLTRVTSRAGWILIILAMIGIVAAVAVHDIRLDQSTARHALTVASAMSRQARDFTNPPNSRTSEADSEGPAGQDAEVLRAQEPPTSMTLDELANDADPAIREEAAALLQAIAEESTIP